MWKKGAWDTIPAFSCRNWGIPRKAQSGEPVSAPIFEPWITRMRSSSADYLTAIYSSSKCWRWSYHFFHGCHMRDSRGRSKKYQFWVGVTRGHHVLHLNGITLYERILVTRTDTGEPAVSCGYTQLLLTACRSSPSEQWMPAGCGSVGRCPL